MVGLSNTSLITRKCKSKVEMLGGHLSLRIQSPVLQGGKSLMKYG